MLLERFDRADNDVGETLNGYGRVIESGQGLISYAQRMVNRYGPRGRDGALYGALAVLVGLKVITNHEADRLYQEHTQ